MSFLPLSLSFLRDTCGGFAYLIVGEGACSQYCVLRLIKIHDPRSKKEGSLATKKLAPRLSRYCCRVATGSIRD
jgi:hypothetical protein